MLFWMPVLFAMLFALSCSGETALTIMENLFPTVDTAGPDFTQNPQVLRYPMWHLTFVVPPAPSTAHALAVQLSVDSPITMRTSSSNVFNQEKSSHTIVDKHSRLQAQKTMEGTFSSSKIFYIRYGIKH